MNPSEQERFRSLIRERIQELEAQISAPSGGTEPVSPDNAVGRLSRLDAMQMQHMALAGRKRLIDERTRLREALQRIEFGRYGRCQLCGKDIAIERLEVEPAAVACVPCSQQRK